MAKKKITKPVIPDQSKKSSTHPSGKGKMKLLWRHKLCVAQGRKAVSQKDSAVKDIHKKDLPKEKASPSPLEKGLVSEKTISDPLENPKMQVTSPSLAMGPVVE